MFELFKKLLTSSRHSSSGGGKQSRTADLLHAMQALYQLSYTPVYVAHFTAFNCCSVLKYLLSIEPQIITRFLDIS